ncbi:uncharacterized protein PHACADRAFT_263068 [Phanerochaete carnosa HHB-10118-sp]|uniref:Uncharacterized protein n=1 Tax=Phanerochaete carnosa (strain HHB-10118-sp) TaxID=650164 RepID=K5VWW9_PHACS|nr:uncharacterized protein PHACADRAFT_263068 [Phanerochaete carnosa HHB-10118-sp]EKM51099.1 hypothetical protein PHACADRAFT_263068 [Phanerochaete carnosa HHB-10118-sp]
MWRVVPPPVPSYPYLPPMPPTALPSDFQMLPVGSSYQQAMQPVPQHASMLQQNSMSVPMSPVPVPSVAAQPAPISGINPPYSVAAQPQLHYAPAPMSHTFGHVPQAPVQSPVADPHVNPAQFRSAGAPSASTDPRPRHLSGAARDRELARIRLQMHHARLQQAMVQQASQQGMPSTSQR